MLEAQRVVQNGVGKCLKICGHLSIFVFVGKHWSFKSDEVSYRKPVAGIQQWIDVGEVEEVQNKLCSCMLD